MFVEAGPDFLCVGMAKAGTGWLFDQVQYHPDFWMPPIKEVHYLNHAEPGLGNARKALRRAKRAAKRGETERGHRRAWEERDQEFLAEAVKLAGEPRDFAKYAAMFRFKSGLISGDVTPGYSGLEGDIIEEIARTFPEIRVVLLVRDPVARAWSQLSMDHRKEKFNTDLLADPVKFRRYLGKYKQLQRLGFPSRIAANWERHAPKVAFRYFFFEDIANKAEDTRRDILTFLGGDPDKSSGELPPDHNRKANAAKLELADGIKAVMADFFKDEIRDSAARFGSHAEEWSALYGL